jgi:hypothetical protein
VKVTRTNTWEGRAVVEWHDKHNDRKVERKVPGKLLLLLGRRAAVREVRKEVSEFMQSLSMKENG